MFENWKRIMSDGPPPRTVRYYEGRYERGGIRLTFRIAPYGGYCTVKRYWLCVYNPTVIQRAEGFDDVTCPPLVCVVFYKLSTAQNWVYQFITEGATITPTQLLPVYS